jgi:hypothetical protein
LRKTRWPGPKTRRVSCEAEKWKILALRKIKLKYKNFDRFVEYIFFAETDLKTSFLKLIKELILKQQRKKHAH